MPPPKFELTEEEEKMLESIRGYRTKKKETDHAKELNRSAYS
jgi:hypothetical protein